MSRRLTQDDYRVMGLPGRFHDVNWQFMLRHELSGHFERYLKNLREARLQGVGLFIGGPPGSGKSYAAAVVAKAFRQNGFSVQWLDAVEGYNLLAFNTEFPDEAIGTWQNRVNTVDLLIIDNFGAERVAGRKNFMLETLKRRCDSKLPTVLTTCLNHAEVAEVYEQQSVKVLMSFLKNVALKTRIQDGEQSTKKMIEENF